MGRISSQRGFEFSAMGRKHGRALEVMKPQAGRGHQTWAQDYQFACEVAGPSGESSNRRSSLTGKADAFWAATALDHSSRRRRSVEYAAAWRALYIAGQTPTQLVSPSPLPPPARNSPGDLSSEQACKADIGFIDDEPIIFEEFLDRPVLKARTRRPFQIVRLGMPVGGETFTRVDSNGGRGMSVWPLDSDASRMCYMHIPRHSLHEFRHFAKGAAEAARRETAADNPYVQALCKHRDELQAYSVVPAPSENTSVYQQLGTEREGALSALTPVTATTSEHPLNEEISSAGDGWAALLPCSNARGQVVFDGDEVAGALDSSSRSQVLPQAGLSVVPNRACAIHVPP